MNMSCAMPLGSAAEEIAYPSRGVRMHDRPDTELATLALHDAAAFDELVRRYRNDVYRLCRYLVRDNEDAWDLSQEAFIKAYRALKKFRGDASFKTWLLRIAANTAKDHLKKRRLKTEPLDAWHADKLGTSGGGPDRVAETNELADAIVEAMETLSPAHRLALTLREMEGLSYEAMAEIMNCRVGTVMSRLHHARRNLRNRLVELGHVEGNLT